MKHSLKKFLALVLMAAMVFSLAAVAASPVSGAEAPASGKTPVAAYSLKNGDLSDKTGNNADLVLDPEDKDDPEPGRTDAERKAPEAHSGRAWAEENGIFVRNGFFKLPETLFDKVSVEDIDGLTVSFTLTKMGSWWSGSEWAETLFSFSDKDAPDGPVSTTSFYASYGGNIGTAEHPYNSAGSQDGAWIDGCLGTNALPYDTTHTVTVTYDVKTNTVIVYNDGGIVANSNDTPYEVKASLTAEQIKNFKSAIIGRPNGGQYGMWAFGTYSDVTIYTTALNPKEVAVLANDGWEAVRDYVAPTSTLVGEGDGTFTAAALNVDGLPVTLEVSLMGMPFRTVTMNEGGPGADGTLEMSQLIAEKGWDILGVSENFNYRDELAKYLTENGLYNELNGDEAEVPESVTIFDPLADDSIDKLCNDKKEFIPLETDGLGLFYKTGAATVTQSDKVAWTDFYSTNNKDLASIGYKVPTENGADGLIQKGFRHFEATINGKLTVDVYTLHMDADSTPEDIAARKSQIKQLVDYIKATNTEKPIIIMGDTNCRYAREDLQTNLVDELEKVEGLHVKDAWKESGSDAGEVVDKIFFINNDKSDYELFVKNFALESIKGAEGSSLSDHKAAVATFAYAKKYDVTYKDGADGKAFADVTYHTYSTNPTPEFEGKPTRSGYTFKGWTPEVAATVTGSVTYTATWEAVQNPGTNPGQPVPPQTGDPSNMVIWIVVAVVCVVGIAVIVVLMNKSKSDKTKS